MDTITNKENNVLEIPEGMDMPEVLGYYAVVCDRMNGNASLIYTTSEGYVLKIICFNPSQSNPQ